MKLSETYMIREFNGSIYAVAVESRDGNTKKPIILNETARILWGALSQERSEAELVDILLGEYDIQRETAEKDTAEFLSVIRKAGLLEE